MTRKRARVTLWLAKASNVWLWHVEIANESKSAVTCDVLRDECRAEIVL